MLRQDNRSLKTNAEHRDNSNLGIYRLSNKKAHTLVRCGLGFVGALAPALALRQRHVLQVLVDHHLQVVVGAVDVGVERHVTLLHGAGGGPLSGGGVCAQQVAQAQFVVAVTRDLHHVVASGHHLQRRHQDSTANP